MFTIFVTGAMLSGYKFVLLMVHIGPLIYFNDTRNKMNRALGHLRAHIG